MSYHPFASRTDGQVPPHETMYRALATALAVFVFVFAAVFSTHPWVIVVMFVAIVLAGAVVMVWFAKRSNPDPVEVTDDASAPCAS